MVALDDLENIIGNKFLLTLIRITGNNFLLWNHITQIMLVYSTLLINNVVI